MATGSLLGRIALRGVVVVALLLSCGLARAAHGAGSSRPAFGSGHGLRVVAVTRFDDRDYNVRVLSADIGRPLDVRILLPVGYAQHSQRRYPVLYLFHGTGGVASDWIKAGDAEQSTAKYPVITVMPECGFNGDGGFWFTNWVTRTTSHGPSQFEDYLISQLVPWVDQNLRTIPDRDGRAVAGLSQGGYGSAEMAARHPDMFVSMATFSGAPEIERDPEVFVGAIGVIEAIEVGEDRVAPFSELGSPVTDHINWEGHDPATLIENLRGMDISLWTGMGVDGPYDSEPNPAGSGIEALVYESTEHFHQHLLAEGMPSYYDNYVYGTHSFPYWARDLRAYLPRMMHAFEHPTHPSRVSYTSIDQRWAQWGYRVTLQRTAIQQFSTLDDATPSGFTLSGSGDAIVVTPASYRAGQRLRVRVTDSSGEHEVAVTVAATGRLTLRMQLGTSGKATVRIAPAP